MQYLNTLIEVDHFLEEHPLTFLFISGKTCSVCVALKPKVEKMLKKYPEIKAAYTQIEDISALAGKFSIFTVPVLLFFVEGKEMIRRARIVAMDDLDDQIRKYYELIVE